MTERTPERAVATEDTGKPLVTIGVFLHNESRFVRDTMASLLAQDYANLEIVISDNCSTDDTGEICRELVRGDQRVRYERQEKNIGAAANSIHVLNRANGEYFMWASGHDLWAPDLVSACVEALETRPGAVLSYASASWIDEEGRALEKESGWYDTRGMGPMVRFFVAFWGNMHPILGVIRTSCLRELPRIHACAGTDQIVLAELALKGDFVHVPTTSWRRRQPRREETHQDKIKRYTSKEFGIAGSWLDRQLPLLRLPLAQMRAVLRSPLTVVEKLAVLIALIPAFAVRYLAGRKS